jgi:hypothetical protein
MRQHTKTTSGATIPARIARIGVWTAVSAVVLLGSPLLIPEKGSAEAAEPSYVGLAGYPPSALALYRAVGYDNTVVVAASGPGVYRQDNGNYRPAIIRKPWSRPKKERGWFYLRGGVFDYENVAKDDFVIGFKVAGRMSDFFSLGLSTDLQRREAYDQVRVEEFRDPTGNMVRSSVTTFASSSNLIPVLAIAEVEIPTALFHPFAGIGGGYEWMVVEFEDYESGLFSKNTYGGLGWQAWAGLAVPMAKTAAITGEIYMNRATVSRDVQEVDTGDVLREEINVNGGGFRAGLRLAF